MALRTTESLQKLFQLTKERQQKKREEKLKAWKENYKLIVKRQNKALQDEKKKRMEQLSTLAPKHSQNVRKSSTERSFKVYHSSLYEREPNEDELYLTREELMDAEDRGEGKINWQRWQELSQQLQEKLQHYENN